jgi:hypothetical protein
MRPTVGIDGVCPPLCTLKEIQDGTYSLSDIELMNQTMKEALDQAIEAREQADADARARAERMR